MITAHRSPEARRAATKPDYVFRFVVGKVGVGGTESVMPRKLSAYPSFDRVSQVWRRIWDPGVELR